MPPQSVVRCLWHPMLNQIMVGMENGVVKSQRGVMLCVLKSKRKKKNTSSPVEVLVWQPTMGRCPPSSSKTSLWTKPTTAKQPEAIQ
ncbi:WD repeat-containing protein 70-like isoform X2 [Carassius auratus]|uniref:WD repeat-containing protein 70-like isoform X2 n=1 Tax=Carassius auratus TaxID=7957 RepID=A0A6P6KVK2_CARAU|nr:WD repeat-containing protein 70-like isoform X2 [Carassius auratus]